MPNGPISQTSIRKSDTRVEKAKDASLPTGQERIPELRHFRGARKVGGTIKDDTLSKG